MKVQQNCRTEMCILASDIARLAKDRLRGLLVDADAKSVVVSLHVRVPGGGRLVEHGSRPRRLPCSVCGYVDANRRGAVKRSDLVQLIRELANSLDYCGWGDAWERECSEWLRERVRKVVLPALACEPSPDGFECLTVRPDRLEPCATVRGFLHAQPNRCRLERSAMRYAFGGGARGVCSKTRSSRRDVRNMRLCDGYGGWE